MRFGLLLQVGALVGLMGCTDHLHIGEDGFFAFALTADTPASVEAEDSAMYVAEQRIELPLRPPTDAQLAELGEGADALPWARRPWVTRGDYELEVDYTLINLEDSRVRVTLSINGINEFHEYMPGFVVDDDEIIAELNQWERVVELDPQERRFGTIREEQLDEVAVDLATVVNGVANAHQVVHPDNHSGSDVRSSGFVPDVVAALTGIRASLVVIGDAGSPPPEVLVEMTVRVRDERGVVLDQEEGRWELPDVELFLPSSLMMEEE